MQATFVQQPAFNIPIDLDGSVFGIPKTGYYNITASNHRNLNNNSRGYNNKIVSNNLNLSRVHGSLNGQIHVDRNFNNFVIAGIPNTKILNSVIAAIAYDNDIIIKDCTQNNIVSSLNNINGNLNYNNIVACNNVNSAIVSVTYSDNLDLEALELARKARKPLWTVKVDEGGNAHLIREF